MKHWLIWSHIQLLSLPRQQAPAWHGPYSCWPSIPMCRTRHGRKWCHCYQEKSHSQPRQSSSWPTWPVWLRKLCGMGFGRKENAGLIEVKFSFYYCNCSAFHCLDSFIWYCWIFSSYFFLWSRLVCFHILMYCAFMMWPLKLCHWLQEKITKNKGYSHFIVQIGIFPRVLEMVFLTSQPWLLYLGDLPWVFFGFPGWQMNICGVPF